MLRAVLLGVLAVTVVAACKSKDDSVAVAPGTVAGKVVEVNGAVSVGAKPLAVGDSVKADDTIETAADASVVIVLAHNNARWSVGPNRKVKALESAAWTAERGAGGNAEQDTSSAGRPAERSAADTSASAKDTQRADNAPAAPAPVAAGDKGGMIGGAMPPPVAAAPGGAGKAMAPPKPSTGDRRTAAHASNAAPPPAPPPPPPTLQAAPDVATTPRGGVAKSLSLTDVAAVLSKCVAAGTKLKLSVHIAAHVPTIKFLSDVDQATKDCLVDAAKHMTLLPESGDIANLELTR